MSSIKVGVIQQWRKMNPILVRQAVISDMEALVPLFDAYRQFYERSSDPARAREFLSARFKNRESVVFIAHDGAIAVGFTQLYPSFSSRSMARIFVLNDLFVREDMRGKGVATKLLDAAVFYAKTHEAVRLTLSTAVTNTTAQSVYEAGGWKRDTQFCHYDFEIPG